MDKLEDKRREKDGDFNKKEILSALLEEADEIEEVAIAIRYKNGDDGFSITTGDIVKALGMLELAKLSILTSSGE